MTQYRKKPVVIEAWLWDGVATAGERPEWLQGADVWADHHEQTLKVKTLEGIMTARVGDLIIRGVKGEIYPCKPDIFAATYEPVPDPINASFTDPRPINSIGGPASGLMPDMAEREDYFRKELASLLNSHSRENGSNTPDFILAQFLCGALAAWDSAVMRRSEWYGGKDKI